MKKSLYKPIVLIVLDGWGISTNWIGNCIASARPRHFDFYWRNFPHLAIQSFAKIAPNSKTLPNSDLGHTILGAGRLVYPISRIISNQIQSGIFYQNPILNKISDISIEAGTNIHLIGELSDTGQYSEPEHLYSLLLHFKNKGIKKVFIHGILDGIDNGPNTGAGIIGNIENKLKEIQIGSITTLVGRNLVFDRETNLNNLNNFINSLTSNSAPFFNSSIEAIKDSYSRRILDSRIAPVIIASEETVSSRIQPEDQIIFFDFYGNNLQNFISIFSKNHKNLYSLGNYNNRNIGPIITENVIKNPLSKVLSENGLKQLKITESYKENNVNYYFNGLNQNPFPGESRDIIKSETSMSIEEFPQMNLYNLTKEAITKINNENFDFILINLPNIDMVAHTGNTISCVNAVKYVDDAMSSIVETVLKKQGCAIVTSDHGIAEDLNRNNFHSLNPVPFILINPDDSIDFKHELLQTVDKGSIVSQLVNNNFGTSDVAPTILDILGINKPSEMTGTSLLPILDKS